MRIGGRQNQNLAPQHVVTHNLKHAEMRKIDSDHKHKTGLSALGKKTLTMIQSPRGGFTNHPNPVSLFKICLLIWQIGDPVNQSL